jgi:3-phosphoshikimate 1-carboxyvinyltransferase
VEVDLSQTPDMVPTAAAVALFCPGATVIRKVAHLRFKESDRLRAISTEWRKLGADVEELPDGLVIKGGRPLHGALVSPHGDHRIAMSLAAASLRIPGVRIAEPEVVEKSFPSFWRLWAGAPRL